MADPKDVSKAIDALRAAYREAEDAHVDRELSARAANEAAKRLSDARDAVVAAEQRLRDLTGGKP